MQPQVVIIGGRPAGMLLAEILHQHNSRAVGWKSTAARTPIAIAMFIPGAVGYALLASHDALLAHLNGAASARYSSCDLSVISLFLLMGQFATQGGLMRALFGLANALIGHFRGGMAMAAILACAMFGAICGSSVTTAATVTQVALPEMRRHHYSGRLATATLAAGGTLGILIPPSVVLVVYGILTEHNIARLFAAAFIPGLIVVVLYLAAIYRYLRRHPHHGPASASHSCAGRVTLFKAVWPVAAIFLLVFSGICGGVFTPTEGAAIGAASTLIAGLARSELIAPTIRDSFLGCAVTTGMMFLIFLGADMLNAALSQMPVQQAQALAGSGWPPLAVILAILVFYVVLGCVMDELSMIVLTIPILFPVVMALDIFGLAATAKAVWFGILVQCVVEVGLNAPPMGLNVYVVNSHARDVSMTEIYRGVLPFLAADAVRVTLLILFPPISLWLARELAP